MGVWRFLVLLLVILGGNTKCINNKIKIWSPTKCEAGRSFFARLNNLPAFSDANILQPYIFPWLVELKIHSPTLTKFCTGALINDRYVLTTQECVLPPVQAQHVTAFLGFYNGFKTDVSEYFQPRTLERGVSAIILHPNYNRQAAPYSLGLLKLTEPVKYSKTIYPVQLPFPGDKFKDYGGAFGENVEWSFFPPGNKQLRQVQVKILNADQCRAFNNNFMQIVTPEVVCALNVGGVQPCGDEAGGLLTIESSHRLHNKTVLVGMSARASPRTNFCRESEPPRVYVRVDQKLEWIKMNTRDAQYCRY